MKIKNKSKVHPTLSSSSSSTGEVELSVLKLLPTAILALASVLSIEDREVLAYMITRSIKTTAPPPSLIQNLKKKSSKKSVNHNNNCHEYSSNRNIHKPPLFDCDCFYCYTSYWFRWDSSPNRELIHQAIEAFEDHLTNGENSKKNGGRTKKNNKTGRRVADKPALFSTQNEIQAPDSSSLGVNESYSTVHELPNEGASPVTTSDIADVSEVSAEEEPVERAVDETAEAEEVEEELTTAVPTTTVSQHKALARKVLPDVIGLFNSRLWSLWSPNV